MKLDNMTVVQQIKILMAISDLNESQLAAKIGVSLPHLSNMLSGRKRFQLEQIEDIAKEFGYDIVFVKKAVQDNAE